MKGIQWLFGALAGLSLLVAGLTATGADLFPNEERSRGSAGISFNGLDFASQDESPAVAGIVATGVDYAPQDQPIEEGVEVAGVDLAPFDRHLYNRGLSALPVD